MFQRKRLSQIIYNFTCPTGYLFDQVVEDCTTNSINCVTSSSSSAGVCVSGTGFSYPGCFKYYSIVIEIF